MAIAPAHPIASARPWAWITRLALLMVIVVVCARATMLESLREPFDPVPGMEAAPRSPGPATSLFLDLLCCAPALLVMLRRAIDPNYAIRWAWSHVIMALLAGWMLASPLWASDRFAALIGAANFVSAMAIIWAASQLVRDWLHLRLVAAAVFGIFLIYVACGIEYRVIDLPDLVRNFNENRDQILKDRGFVPGSFPAEQFEKKVLSGDIGCFSSSPNTYATALVLMGIVAGGIAIQRLVNRDEPGWAIAILIAFPAAAYCLYYTHSRTAFLTPVVAAAIFGCLGLWRGWLARRATLVYALAVSLFVLGAVAVVGHGLAHGNLVEKSLTFRWYYWTGAARLVQQHPVLGIGWNNFGQRYPQVRVPLATEEVQDPHNFLVKSFAELGIVGGILMAMWMLRLWWELSRPSLPQATAQSNGRRGLRLFAMLAIGATLLNLLLSIDWSQMSAWIQYQAFRRLIGAVLLLAGMAVAGWRSLREDKVDERPAPWILYGLLVGGGTFLLHNLIDFSLFETGPLFLFALVIGSALGMRLTKQRESARRRGGAMAMFIVALAAWLGVGGFLLARTAEAELAADTGADALRRGNFELAARQYRAAFDAQPLNFDYAMHAAQAMIFARAPARDVRAALESAIRADPDAGKPYILLGEFEFQQPSPDIAAVRRAYERALELDPYSVGLRITYADHLASLGQRADAAAQYSKALHDDDLLPKDEPKRLAADRRADVAKKLAEAGKGGG